MYKLLIHCMRHIF